MHRSPRLVVALITLLSIIVPALHRNATPSFAAGGGGASINLSKTVTSASFNPTMSLALAVDHATAIPGDRLTYTATVTNTGATLTMTGTITAQNGGDIPANVTAYADDVEYYSKPKKQWLPLAGMTVSQPGYTLVAPLTTASGMQLSLTSVPASGVTYPTSGDPILGTQLAVPSTASWNYTATAQLTASQVQVLSSTNGIGGLRNVIHLEVQPRALQNGQPYISRAELNNPFQSASPAISNISVAIDPPGATEVTFNSSTTPALASLAPGASTTVSTAYTVPPIAAKDPTVSDADYLASLATVNGSKLDGRATATGTGATGAVRAGPSYAQTTEYVPVLSITKSGPASAAAGTTQTYPLTLANTGGATGSALAVTDTLPGGATGTVAGAPSSLVAGGSAKATASYPIPAGQPAGGLTDTASLTWQDANGNNYGPVSASYTTTVTNNYSGASLKLSPSQAGPNVLGTKQQLTAVFLDSSGNPLANQSISFSIAGPNATTGSAMTDNSGTATFSYSGSVGGTDTVQATFSGNGATIQSNTGSIGWIKPVQPISSTTVTGNFYSESSSATSFVAQPGDTPVFSQSFPTIEFDPPTSGNPPTSIIPHTPSTVTVAPGTRPFTDLTTDVGGNYMGQIVAQGNGHQAGIDSLASFNAVFTASFTVAQAEDVTFQLNVNAGYLFGVAGGASRVSGDYQGTSDGAAPSFSTTPFKNYPLVAAYDMPTSGIHTITVHFPAPGTYPYELDYFERAGDALTLALGALSYTQNTSPLSVYVGYADSLRPNPSLFPTPWCGAPNVSFNGDPNAGQPGDPCRSTYFDGGAIRFDNSTSTPISLGQVSVRIGGYYFALWGTNQSVPANGTLILTQTQSWENFDSSDTPITCSPDRQIPQISATVNGTATTYADSNQILNTGGIDPPSCGRGNESHPWSLISGNPTVAVNLPVAPSATLTLAPAPSINALTGQTQAFSVEAMDGSGRALSSLNFTLHVYGANGQDVASQTDASGLATPSYLGMNAGTDQVQAQGFVAGMLAFSPVTTVTWTNPAPPTSGSGGTGGSGGSGGPGPCSSCPPPPGIDSVSPKDGIVVSKPTPITANFTPPAGAKITSWSVTYQALDPEPPVTLASGTGTPPDTLATFDPTVLDNDTYLITVSATASNGGTQSVSSTVAVTGNLKLGRYVTTYQDLNVPVDGFQMQVNRTYDSYDKRSGDFGYGWHIGLSNFRVSENRQLGAGGWVMYDTFCFGFCLTAFRSTTPHFVTVTFPDGHQEQFDFTPKGGTNIFLDGTAAFTPRPGTTSTLQVAGDAGVTYLYDGNLYGGDYSTLYNPQRFLLTTRDGRQFVLDLQGGLISETDRSGNSLTVDSTGVHASNGESLTYTRDSQNRITQITGPTNQVLSYTYDSSGNLAGSTDASGKPVTYTYDGNHNLLSVSGSGSTPLVTLSYGSDGRLASIQQGSNAPETISNNVGAQQQSYTDPMGRLTTLDSFDDRGDLVEEDRAYTDPATGSPKTLSTTWTYDANGHPLSRRDPLSHTISAQYSANGDLTDFIDAAGHHTQYTYNGYGQVTAVNAITSSGTVSLASMTYNSRGQLTALSRPDSTAYTYAYNGGLVSSITDPQNRQTQFQYDGNGHLAQVIDPSGHSTVYSLDASGNILSVKDANGHTSSFAYNGDGKLTDSYDANNNHRQYTYDALGHLTRVTDPLGHSDSYQYNSAGQLSQTTDRNGQVISYAYDGDGRVQSVTLGSNVTSYQYDPLGRLIAASNSSATDQFAYDDAGRLVAQTTSGASQPNASLSYGYDAADARTSVTGPDGTTAYGYDALARLQQITDPSNGHFTFGYDSLSRLSSLTRPNNVNDSFTYDNADDLQSRIAALNGTAMSQAAYGYDPNGLRSSLATLTNQATYQHDSIGQLTAATYTSTPPANESYQYDAVGNRIASAAPGSLTYDPNDRLTASPAYTYQYDNEGDLVQKTNVSTNAATKYQWNALHQLLEIDYPDGTKSTYQYDPFGRRIQTNDNGTLTRYVYDGDNIHLEYNGANSLQASYVDSLTVDTPLEMVRAGKPYYYLLDGLGSTTALTDSAGNVANSYTYDAFGNQTSTGSVSNPFTYTGRERDAKSGLYYNRARYYDPSIGRFLSEDPIASLNPYPYVQNNPTDFVDPSGADDVEEEAILASELPEEVATEEALPDWVVNTFRGGRYTPRVLEEPTTFYRAGVEDPPLGQFFSEDPPISQIQTRIDKAIPPVWPDGTPAPLTTGYAVQIPAGTTVYDGVVGSQGGWYMGGTNQVFIPEPWNIPGVQIVGSWPLP